MLYIYIYSATTTRGSISPIWCNVQQCDERQQQKDGAFYKSTQSFHKQKATSLVTSSRIVHVEWYELKAGHGDGVRTSP
jgi:hypothetical protein